MVTYLGSLVQSCCGEAGALQTNITGVRGECSQCLGHTGFAPLTACVLSQSTLLRLQVALQLSKAGLGCVPFPGLSHSGSGSSGTPQRRRLGWACVLCPSQVQAAQVTRCLVSALFHVGCVLVSFPVLDAQFPGCTTRAPSQVCFVSPLGS